MQLTGANAIAAGATLMITSAGSGYTSPPTTGTVSAGTATSCSATSLAVSTALGGALDLLTAVAPVTPSAGHGRIWFDVGADWPLTVPMGIDQIGTFQANGRSVFVEEFGPEAGTLSGGATGGACAIIGLQSCTWNTLNQDFFASLLSFLASQGVTDASLYGTEIIGACAPAAPDNAQSTNTLAAVTTAMLSHQYSAANSRMAAILSQWRMNCAAAASLSGTTFNH